MTANNQHTDQEMRRGKRFEISQSAVITQPGHSGIVCEIRDFCVGGLFLKFADPEAAIASLPIARTPLWKSYSPQT